MSGGRDLPATPRRLREARRRGVAPRSRELQWAAAFAAGLGAIPLFGPGAIAALAGLLRAALTAAPAGDVAPLRLLGSSALLLGRAAAPLLLLPAAAAAAAALLGGGFLASAAPLRFRLERLSPAQGLRRLLSAASAGALLLALAKVAVVAAILGAWFRESARALAQLPRAGLPGAVRSLPAGPLALRLAFAALAFGALDLALAHRRHARALRMTREEVRREAKEDEGDPRHREERRRLHRAALEAGPVAKATVVIVNPTRVAVALLHRRGADGPPRLLAKGTGAAAARIRSEARRAAVPIVRDPPLARALLRLADVGDEIPEELYEGAAAVLAHVYGREREGA